MQRPAGGIVRPRLEDEAVGFLGRVGVGNRRRHLRHLGPRGEGGDRRRIRGARPAQPQPLGFEAENIVACQVREHFDLRGPCRAKK